MKPETYKLLLDKNPELASAYEFVDRKGSPYFRLVPSHRVIPSHRQIECRLKFTKSATKAYRHRGLTVEGLPIATRYVEEEFKGYKPAEKDEYAEAVQRARGRLGFGQLERGLKGLAKAFKAI